MLFLLWGMASRYKDMGTLHWSNITAKKYTGSSRSKARLNLTHEMDSNLSISPKMSYGVLEHDIAMLQNYIFMIL